MIESTRNLIMYGVAHPRMVEIVHLLGSSSFMITPSETDLDIPLSADIAQYLATDKSTARDRGRLFRLASDLAISCFENSLSAMMTSDGIGRSCCARRGVARERSAPHMRASHKRLPTRFTLCSSMSASV